MEQCRRGNEKFFHPQHHRFLIIIVMPYSSMTRLPCDSGSLYIIFLWGRKFSSPPKSINVTFHLLREEDEERIFNSLIYLTEFLDSICEHACMSLWKHVEDVLDDWKGREILLPSFLFCLAHTGWLAGTCWMAKKSLFYVWYWFGWECDRKIMTKCDDEILLDAFLWVECIDMKSNRIIKVFIWWQHLN